MNPAPRQHTPGPWTILPNTPHFVRAMHPTEGMQPIATVYHFDGELAANARLIAAAPELLEACKKALMVITSIKEVLKSDGMPSMLKIEKEIQQAISKAEATHD